MITLILAISWSIILIWYVILANLPENIRMKPTWLNAILPTLIIVINCWVEVFR